ncbi:helix-turn-helix domain-containing protein [Streptomyces sp. NBC_01373]|uniref:helix-turn-helix domain-containing protein n=1 Tax=Streptomyces sp. NBC_01373 TaxID=2903843 RepID=UPI0022549AD9|nr:helix-turn-helix domain-containing protein [Streptomyces sp. NBC_01373]MCX4699522.1 DNA-binding protein [Streptomyces sp. NBC_01373]
MSATWTREAIEALGPTTDVPTVAAIFGVNKDTVYAQIRRGEWTATRVLPLGRKLKIPTRDLIALLYAPEPAPQVNPAVPSQCHHPEFPQVTTSTPHASCGCTPAESAVIRPLRGA